MAIRPIMKPDEIVTQFAETTLSFDNIIGQPTDSYIVRLFEAMPHILLTVPYNEAHGKHSLIGFYRGVQIGRASIES